MLAASVQVDLFDGQTGKPYERGIAMLPIPPEVREWSNDARALAAEVRAAGDAVPSDANYQFGYTACKFQLSLMTEGRESSEKHFAELQDMRGNTPDVRRKICADQPYARCFAFVQLTLHH